MKPTGTADVLVTFFRINFAHVSITLYEGKTLEECIRMKDSLIDGYFIGSEYHEI